MVIIKQINENGYYQANKLKWLLSSEIWRQLLSPFD